MSFRKIKPTKLSLLNLLKKQKMAQKGKNFLEFKLKEFIFKIKEKWNDYTSARTQFINDFKDIIINLNDIYAELGWLNFEMISKLKKKVKKPEIKIKYKKEITNIIPIIELKSSKKKTLPDYSLLDTTDRIDDFFNIDANLFLKSLIKFAKAEDIMLKYAINYQKINRRINSLDKIVIPNLESNINRIKGILEELERENYVRLKKTKNIIKKEVVF